MYAYAYGSADAYPTDPTDPFINGVTFGALLHKGLSEVRRVLHELHERH